MTTRAFSSGVIESALKTRSGGGKTSAPARTLASRMAATLSAPPFAKNGKLAHRLKQQGRKPLVVAADTYRAAGIEQMTAWAERAGVDHFAGKSGADPASVVFDGMLAARSRGTDVVLVDTAGRLQTQRNLVEELAKIGRVASKALEGGTYESLLVIDAVLGLTSVVQAREFNRAIPMTGVLLAKLDSSAKGGAVIAIESELGVPAKLAGVGEGIDDLTAFDPEAFVRSLFEA